MNWPGVKMKEEGKGWYSYEISDYSNAKVLFSNGKNEQIPDKTSEGYFVEGEQWYKEGKWYSHKPKEIVVHFYTEDWKQPCIYYYQSDNNIGKAWPGETMKSEGDGWFCYTITEFEKPKVLFNDGKELQIPEKNEQGFQVNGETWYKDGAFYKNKPDNVVVHYYKPDNWDIPNLYYYKTKTETGPEWPGKAMQDEGNGWYRFEISRFVHAKILFNDKKNQVPQRMEEGFDVTSGESWYRDGIWYKENPDANQYKIVPEQLEYDIEIGEKKDIYFSIVDKEETQCNFSYQVVDKDNIIKENNGQTNEFGVGEIIVSNDEKLDTEIVIKINDNIQQKVKLNFSPKKPSITDKPNISYGYGTDSIIISWEAIKNATGYEVYKSCNQGDYEKISTTDQLEFIDGELQSGFTYDYYIKAINEGEESKKSNKIHLEYIQNIDNLGELFASTTSVYKNTDEEVVFQIAPSVKLMDNLVIKVKQLDENNKVIGTLVDLKDTGIITQGDDIANDGIYSGKVKLNTCETKKLKYQAVATIKIEDEEKELFSKNQLKIDVINKISDGEINCISKLTNIVQDKCNIAENTMGNREKAECIVGFLKGNMEVENAGISKQSNTVYCLLKSGIKVAVPIAELGTNSFDLYDGNKEVEENYQKDVKILEAAEMNAYLSEGGKVSLEDLKTLYQYQIIILNASGEIYDDTPYLCTNTRVSKEMLFKYEQDIKEGNVILVSTKNGLYFGALPQYIEKYNKEFDESILFLTASKSMANEKMCHVFKKLGAGCVFGFRDSVLAEDAEIITNLLIESLVTDELTTAQAYDWIIEQLGNMVEKKKSSASTISSNFASYEVSEIQLETVKNARNGSFENDFEGWKEDGDTRIINQLGELVPIDGKKMAIISTGLGAVSDSDSSLKQKIHIEEANAKVSISYNFISEEPMEFVGAEFDDKFQCRINEDIIISESVNKSNWIPAKGIDFAGGDSTTFMTGWITHEYDLSGYIGEDILLEFRIWDVGDSEYDSAALIDNIYFQNKETEEIKESIMWPTESKKIMSYFEEKDMVTEKNKGINIMVDSKEAVMASHEGTVTDISSSPEYGDYIEIENDWDEFSIITRYANVQLINVAVGEEVEVGKEIAKVANRGSIGGNILHFEVIEKKGNEERQVNPYQYIMPISNKNVQELEYLSQPYFTTISTSSVKGKKTSLIGEVRYITNLDLDKGEVYLEKLYPILKDKGDSMKKKSSTVIKVKLNGKAKTFGTAKKYNNAKLVNGHLVVNLEKFMKYFYRDYSEIFSGNYNKKFIIGEKKYYQEIEKLQAKLKALGYCAKNGDEINVNGYFDMNTAYAVTLYSSAHGLNIAGMDNKTPGIGININSVIWFTLFSGRAKKYSNVIKEATFIPKTKNLLNQYCYVFFATGWEKEAKDNKKTLEDYFNMPDKNVIIKPINQNNDLIKAWNGMDMVKKQKVYIKAVVLNTHANNFRLGYVKNETEKFTLTQVFMLDKTYIEYLILLGCNAAHQDYPDNIASLFARKNGYKGAIGSDGTVGYGKKYCYWGDWIYTPKADDEFKDQSKKAGVCRTECNGFIKMSYNSKGKKKERVIGKKLTLTKLLERY